MNQYWILVAILLPMIGGVSVRFFPLKKRKEMYIFLQAIMITTSLIVWGLILGGKTEAIHVVHFVEDLSISFPLISLLKISSYARSKSSNAP